MSAAHKGGWEGSVVGKEGGIVGRLISPSRHNWPICASSRSEKQPQWPQTIPQVKADVCAVYTTFHLISAP